MAHAANAADDRSPALKEARDELERLIGLSGVKEEVNRLLSFLQIQTERRRQGLPTPSQSLHFVFSGNPGTGKTTVARILAKIFFGFGILKTEKTVECDRAKLVAEYLGQTAVKTDKVIQSALDGVLFIDEAYTLVGDATKYGHGDSYGDEAINTLLKHMEDSRDRLVVIAAGYPGLMENFVRSNPGLESRFTRFIRFDDYTVPDLCRIFGNFCHDAKYSLTPVACARAFLAFAAAYQQRDERFGNARFVRNTYEKVLGAQADRLAKSGAKLLSKSSLMTIDGDDIALGIRMRNEVSGFDLCTIDVTQSKWDALCPGCGKEFRNGGIRLLGQNVTCACGNRFCYPWWNLVAHSIPSLPERIVAASRAGDKASIAVTPEAALKEAQYELERLIGLSGVKEEVSRLTSFLQIQTERRSQGLPASSQSLHFVFSGNPGTGKTTVARILAKIFFGFGILKTAKTVECDRAKLVGEYLGQTAVKTDKVVQSALDGVLFIDEAYTLAGDAKKYAYGDSYGDEAINTLLTHMENSRDRLVVIAAGYPGLMDTFVRSNPGLESRFTRFIRFDDYTVPDLCRIFGNFCHGAEYGLTPVACARAFLAFAAAYQQRDERFGNARYVRNAYERVLGAQADRLAKSGAKLSKSTLMTIDGNDIAFGVGIGNEVSGFDLRSIDMAKSKWDAECPGCGKEFRNGAIKLLGQIVTCACGQKFYYPWWNLVGDSIPNLPDSIVAAPRPCDKAGIAIVAQPEHFAHQAKSEVAMPSTLRSPVRLSDCEKVVAEDWEEDLLRSVQKTGTTSGGPSGCDEVVAQDWAEYLRTIRETGQASVFVERHSAERLGVWKYAAERGDHAAQVLVGQSANEPKESARWLRKAADQGNAHAQNLIAVMYFNGRGVVQNDGEAAAWLRKAAEQGDQHSQYNLGGMYQMGRGVPKSDETAVEWYFKSAQQGYASAEYQLGEMIDQGRGVAQDRNGAMIWYRRAAEQGHEAAKKALSRLPAEAGVPVADRGSGIHLKVNGQQQGPYPQDQIKTMLKSRLIPPETEYWNASLGGWKPLVELALEWVNADRQPALALGKAELAVLSISTDGTGAVARCEIALKAAGRGRINALCGFQKASKDTVKVAWEAASQLRAHFDLPSNFTRYYDITVHDTRSTPLKADIPSAGLGYFIGIIAALRGTPVRSDVAITGEITILGKVLAVTGIEQKIRAGREAGYAVVIVPSDNRGDIAALPADLRGAVRVVPVASVLDAIPVALLGF